MLPKYFFSRKITMMGENRRWEGDQIGTKSGSSLSSSPFVPPKFALSQHSRWTENYREVMTDYLLRFIRGIGRLKGGREFGLELDTFPTDSSAIWTVPDVIYLSAFPTRTNHSASYLYFSFTHLSFVACPPSDQVSRRMVRLIIWYYLPETWSCFFPCNHELSLLYFQLCVGYYLYECELS